MLRISVTARDAKKLLNNLILIAQQKSELWIWVKADQLSIQLSEKSRSDPPQKKCIRVQPEEKKLDPAPTSKIDYWASHRAFLTSRRPQESSQTGRPDTIKSPSLSYLNRLFSL